MRVLSHTHMFTLPQSGPTFRKFCHIYYQNSCHCIATATSTQCKLQNMPMCNVSTLVHAWSVKEKPPPVQVAGGIGSMVVSYVFTLVNVVVGTGKTPPAKVTGGAYCKYK